MEVNENSSVNTASYTTVWQRRVRELLRALECRSSQGTLTQEDANAMKLWAVELNEQIDLLNTMLIYDT